jgi:7,8-dihydroneopterin 2',3'-cyclic phosphate phosphodiesterase
VSLLLNPKLRALTSRIRDKSLREKTLEVLKNPSFEVAGKKHEGLSLDVSPAGLSHHHCYPGGYVEHIVSAAEIALALCDSVEKIYHGKVNRDLVLAGILLHDVFKVVTYEERKTGGYDSTRLADYLDHLSLATAELVRRGFPLELVHIVSAHHGAYGPIRPRTVEALICHLADLADSRLNGEVLSAAAYLSRRAVGEELFSMNSKEAFEIVRSKTLEGWEGVTKAVEEIRRKRKSR